MDRDNENWASAERVGDEIAVLATNIDAALHRLLTCIRRFDESEEWGRQGAISCAHWLSWRIHLDLGTAREKVRVARALGDLPRIDEALRQGVLSYAKVRALTRVATPQTQDQLLEIARSSTGAQLERLCRAFRKVVTVDDHGNRLDEYRRVDHRVLDNGMVRITAVLHPDEADTVMKAIDQARRPPPPTEQPAGEGGTSRPSSRPPYISAEERKRLLPAPDALVKLALASLTPQQPAGDRPAPSAGDRAAPSMRPLLVVHVGPDPLSAGTLAATLDDGTRLSAETLRRLSCDANLVPVKPGASGPRLDLGRQSRTVSPALHRALLIRDKATCRFPGCTHRRFLHDHHINHWAHGGQTNLDNLILLCTHHHRLVHEGGFGISADGTGAITFTTPRGLPIA